MGKYNQIIDNSLFELSFQKSPPQSIHNVYQLELAILNRDIDLVKKLLNIGVDPDNKTSLGITMYQLATSIKSGSIWILLKNTISKKKKKEACFNPSPFSLQPYVDSDTDLIAIKFPNQTSGWGIRGECILRTEIAMYLSRDLSENKNSTSPARSLMANWIGNWINNNGLGGSAGGKLYFRLPTTNCYITWKSLSLLLLDKSTNIWYAHPISTERLGNLWSSLGSGQNHGQYPGFTVYKLSNNTKPQVESPDEYILDNEKWLTPLKSHFQYHIDIDHMLDLNINSIITRSNVPHVKLT